MKATLTLKTSSKMNMIPKIKTTSKIEMTSKMKTTTKMKTTSKIKTTSKTKTSVLLHHVHQKWSTIISRKSKVVVKDS